MECTQGSDHRLRQVKQYTLVLFLMVKKGAHRWRHNNDASGGGFGLVVQEELFNKEHDASFTDG
jgi:hypothetical protein